jgi:hypothetical protein
MHFNVFDILDGEFLNLLTRTIEEQKSTMSEEDIKKTTDDVEEVLRRLTEFSRATIFFVDQPIVATKIVNIFKNELSKYLSLLGR